MIPGVSDAPSSPALSALHVLALSNLALAGPAGFKSTEDFVTGPEDAVKEAEFFGEQLKNTLVSFVATVEECFKVNGAPN